MADKIINKQKSDKKNDKINQKEIKTDNFQNENILGKLMQERNKVGRSSEIFELQTNFSRNSILISDFKERFSIRNSTNNNNNNKTNKVELVESGFDKQVSKQRHRMSILERVPSMVTTMFNKSSKAENQKDESGGPSDVATRKNNRIDILSNISKKDFSHALNLANDNYERTEKMKNENSDQGSIKLEDNIMDYLMYAKLNMICQKATNINPSIQESLKLLNQNITFDYKLLKIAVKNEINENKKQAISQIETNSGKSKTTSKKKTSELNDIEGFKRVILQYSIIGNLFNAIGDDANCEKIYLKIAKCTEKLYGLCSTEISGVYYSLGIYYYAKNQLIKSLICFRKSLFNIVKLIGDDSNLSGDCHYNLGIVYKKMSNFAQAKIEFEFSLRIRASLLGKYSLLVAKSFEELGKLAIETKDYKSAISYLFDCLEIRKVIHTSSEHQDIKRISILLIYMSEQITCQINDKSGIGGIGLNHSSDQQQRFLYLQNQFNSNFLKNSLFEQFLKTENTIKSISNKSKINCDSKRIKMNSEQINNFEKPINSYFTGKVFSPEDIIHCLLFVLSLSSDQISFLRKSQPNLNESKPIDFPPEFLKILSPYQSTFFKCIKSIPKILLLKFPNDDLTSNNLKLPTITESIEKQLRLKEADIVLQYIYDSDKINSFEESQIRILTSLINLEWPISLFVLSFTEQQIKSIILTENETQKNNQEIISEYQKLKKRDIISDLNNQLFKSDIPLYENLRGFLLYFGQFSLKPNLIPKINFDLQDSQFQTNLSEYQIDLIDQIKAFRIQMEDAKSANEQHKNLVNIKTKLCELFESFDYFQSYMFASVNSFILDLKNYKNRKLDKNIESKYKDNSSVYIVKEKREITKIEPNSLIGKENGKNVSPKKSNYLVPKIFIDQANKTIVEVEEENTSHHSTKQNSIHNI